MVLFFYAVAPPGLEPGRQSATDFKSVVSTFHHEAVWYLGGDSNPYVKMTAGPEPTASTFRHLGIWYSEGDSNPHAKTARDP